MKWYTCCNHKGLINGGECLLVAIHSCLTNTALEPHFVFYGEANSLTDYLRSIGVNVHIHFEPLRDDLICNHLCKKVDIDWLIGSSSRFYLPLLESNDDYILYTDTDVLFLRDFDIIVAPAAVTAASELINKNGAYIVSEAYFNAGVLILNTKVFRNLYRTFRADCIKIARGERSEPWYDQGLLNSYFSKHWQKMPQAYNWRPFYNKKEEIVVIHYQYLKPNMITRSGILKRAENPESEIYAKFSDVYLEHKLLYDLYLNVESLRALVGAVPNAVLS